MSTRSADLLAAIVGATRRRVEADRARIPLEHLQLKISAGSRRDECFRDALTSTGRVNVIAECKRRSPSRGVLRAHYDPVDIARSYEREGAVAVSVLTEPGFFDGSLEHLERVRAAVKLPILRKDFTIDPYQIWQARASGADAVLLIVATLDDRDLIAFRAEARRAGVDALVEVHDEDELGRALAAGADLIGVNNRNLRTLAVDLGPSIRLAAFIPRRVTVVAESGLQTPDDIRALTDLGYRGFLVGERFMTVDDPGAALRELLDGVKAEGPPSGGPHVRGGDGNRSAQGGRPCA